MGRARSSLPFVWLSVVIAVAGVITGCPPQQQEQTIVAPPPPPPPPPSGPQMVPWPQAGAPLPNLAPATALVDAPRESAVHAVRGNVVAIGSGGAVSVYTLGRGFPRQGGIPAIGRIADLSGPGVFVTRDLIVGASGGGILAIDPTTGQRKWTVVVDASAQDLTAKAAVQGGSVVVVAVYRRDAGAAETVFAVDAENGLVRWRQDVAAQRIVADDTRAYVLGSDGSLRAFDLNEGTVAWQQPPPRARGRRRPELPTAMAAFGGNLLVGTSAGKLRIADPTTGRTATEHALGTDVAITRIEAEGDLVVATLEQLRDDGGAATVVVGVAPDGTERWRTPELESVIAGGAPQLTIGSDAVYLCGPDQFVRALDRSSGQPRWGWSLGRCRPFAVLEPLEGAAPLVVATLDGDATRVFARAPSEPRWQQVTVEGSVAAPAPGPFRVRVGSKVVTTDADGAFRAELAARGVLSVETNVQLPDGGQHLFQLVPVDRGPGPYQVRLEAHAGATGEQPEQQPTP